MVASLPPSSALRQCANVPGFADVPPWDGRCALQHHRGHVDVGELPMGCQLDVVDPIHD